MHRIYPTKFENWAFRGMTKGLTDPAMYCQSKQTLSSPKPSLPLDPPNTRVKSMDDWFARQKMELKTG